MSALVNVPGTNSATNGTNNIPLVAIVGPDGTLTGVGKVGIDIPASSAVAGALNGSAAQAVTDITGAAAIPANTVFSGFAGISLSASQNAALAVAGTVRASISWVPGTAGTTAVDVAAINLNFGVGSATNLTAPHSELTVAVPVIVYVGTTTGRFRVTVATTGTVTALQWDATVSGSAR